MSTTVATSTSQYATAQGITSGRKIDRNQDGTLWAAYSANGTTLTLAYSKDNGATWTPVPITTIPGFGNATTDTLGWSIFIDLDDNLHMAWSADSTNGIYYCRATPNAGRTAWTWSATLTNVATGSAAYCWPDLVAFRDPTPANGWHVAIVYSYTTGVPEDWALYVRFPISAAGVVGARSSDSLTGGFSAAQVHRPVGGNYGVGAHTYPAIDFNHTGDGKTVQGGTPHLYAGWVTYNTTASAPTPRFRKGVWAAGAWTWNPERTLDTGNSGYGQAPSCFFDGTRWIMVLIDAVTGPTWNLHMYERDAADTTNTVRTLIAGMGDTNAANPAALWYQAATYDSAGNVYVFGRSTDGANGTRKFQYRRWVRATNTFEAAVVLDTTTPDAPTPSVKRGYSASSIELVRVDGTSTPWNVTYDRVSLNQAPNASTGLTPATGTVDRTAIQRLAWTFSDPNAGDTQSASEVQWRLGAGAWTSVPQTSPNAYWDAPAGTFPAGSIEWQVRTTDAAGAVGPWSASAFFTAASPPVAPVITAPVNGSTIASNAAVATWTAPAQSDYQVRTVADAAGAPNTGVVYTDSGIITDTAARTRSLAFAVNNRFEHVQVRVRTNGLWSTWASVRVQISFTPPPVPTLVAAANGALGAIAVTITNPAPGGGEPALAYNDLYRRVAGVGAGVRIGTGLPSGVFTDRTPASGVAYEYLARAVATNGTTRDSAWTT